MREANNSVRRALSWRELAAWSAVATLIVLLVTAFVTMTYLLLIPPVLLAIGAILARRPGKAGPIMLAVVALLFVLTNAPFLVPFLIVPASWINFILSALILVTSVVLLAGAIGAIRRPDQQASAAPRMVAFVGLGAAALSIVVGAVAGFSYDRPSHRSGDVELSAKTTQFEQTRLSAPAGVISVFVDNNDPVLHTFTINRCNHKTNGLSCLNVNLNVPANSAGRISFQADAGSYPYLCTLHADTMRGTLVVHE